VKMRFQLIGQNLVTCLAIGRVKVKAWLLVNLKMRSQLFGRILVTCMAIGQSADALSAAWPESGERRGRPAQPPGHT
jgi:hypothetical protein